MKTKHLIMLICLLAMATPSQAQFFKKLGKAAERAAERTVERRVEKETTKSTDRALDTVIEAPKKKKERKRRKKKKKKSDSGNIIGGNNSDEQTGTESETVINSNFDFTPGTVPIFQDNFSSDNIGDFPANWDSNGSGELVTIKGEKWLRLGNNATIYPMLKNALPENYTIQFDLFTDGIDNKTDSYAFFKLLLHDTQGFQSPKSFSLVELSPCQFIESQGVIEKHVNGTREIRNKIGKDIRNAINGKSRVSIAVNKTRMRVWLNAEKIVDIPRLVPENAKYFKLYTTGLRDNGTNDKIYIANFSIAKSGEDNRSKLLTEGRLSTNAILFNTGSASIKSGADAILAEIGEAMKTNPTVNILIVGHTDTDGDADSNLVLSQQRAISVKEALIQKYGISANRIKTDGKGESSPIANNTTSAGKSQNRRVEFIKL
ncbi:OmpA family protein [Rasiella rasia]|uniref:OmpA family protein n=1 Tax=Rasiella rasia TaxID=2744027 RepID=A0A6G6GRG4_9FLAO|nr:OmpA family protein [Rasiella rasia]QIE60301.1 OmpA family protein [Rasiella rasia]